MAGDVNFKFGADISELTSKMSEVQSKMKESFSGISEGFDKIGKGMLAFSAALAGGAAFKEMISKTIEMSSEANKLGHALGISATEASTLAVALDDIHSSTEQYLGIAGRLQRQVKANEQGLNDFGLKTRDSTGALKGQRELMMESMSLLNRYAEGSERNQAAMKLFGGRVGDITQLLKLNNEVMEAALKKQEELGMTVTPNNIVAMKEYKDMLNDVHDVFNAVQKVIGDVIIPRLTAMGKWFAEQGPNAVKLMAEAMRTWLLLMDTLGDSVSAVGSVIMDVFRAIGAAINSVFGSGGSGVTALEFVVNVFKVVQIAIVGFRVAFELAFIVINNLLLQSMSWFNRFAEVIKAAFNLDWDGVKSAWKKGDSEIEDINQQMLNELVASSGKAKDDIDAIVMRPISTSASDKGAGTEKAKPKADRTMLDTSAFKLREEQLVKLAKYATIEIEIEQNKNKFLLDAGKINQEQYLKLQAETSKSIYDIEEKKQQDIHKLWAGDPERVRKIDAEMELAKKEHTKALLEEEHKRALESEKVWSDYFTSFHNSIDNALTDMILGTKSFMQAMTAIGTQMLRELINILVKKATTWVAVESGLTAATTAGEAVRTAVIGTAAGANASIHAGQAVKSIAIDAPVAGAGAAAQSAPYTGWGAIAIGAAVMAAVLALTGNIKSSAGGEWRVGSDRLNMVHKDETILPANIAIPLRQNVEAGGGLGGGGMTVNISAIDAKGVKQFFDSHGSSIADSLMKQKRDFKGGFA